VSCTSAIVCKAVGSYESTYGGEFGTGLVLAESRSGKTWTIDPAPDPAGSPGSDLLGLSCGSPTSCTAVGAYGSASPLSVALTFVEFWNGSDWSIENSPNPPGGTGGVLSGVSCVSAVACTSVGLYEPGAQSMTVTLAEVWDGSAWHLQAPVNLPGATGSLLSAVSCASATACVAVGSYNDLEDYGFPLAEIWNGSKWTIASVPMPAAAVSGVFADVSCVSARACIAVGNYLTGEGVGVAMVEAWNGYRWSIEATPTPARALDTSLWGISCASADACTAVGGFDTPTGRGGSISEEWNGTAWTIHGVPLPVGAIGGRIEAVSCTAARACTAVGGYGTRSGGGLTLAEAWNGATWTIQATPNPHGGGSELSAVSCTSATACMATGSYATAFAFGLTIAESWNGKGWVLEKTPNVAGEDGSVFTGVSCVSPADCTAVGLYFDNSANNGPLAEVWDGTRWAMEATAATPGTISSALQGISCTTAAQCTAVGYWKGAAPTAVTLAEVS
jgi:hypothetical protein